MIDFEPDTSTSHRDSHHHKNNCRISKTTAKLQQNNQLCKSARIFSNQNVLFLLKRIILLAIFNTRIGATAYKITRTTLQIAGRQYNHTTKDELPPVLCMYVVNVGLFNLYAHLLDLCAKSIVQLTLTLNYQLSVHNPLHSLLANTRIVHSSRRSLRRECNGYCRRIRI